MVDRPSEVDQVRLLIRNLQPTYRQHLQFTLIDNFFTLRNVGMLIVEELARETHAKAGWKNNSQNKEKKTGSSSNKEVHAINFYMKYTPTGLLIRRP